MWQLPPHEVKQEPPQCVEPSPDNVRPPATADTLPKGSVGTYLLNTDLPSAQKEWILWKNKEAESIEEQIAKLKRSIEEHRGCAQLSQSTSSKEDARAAKEPRCDSTQCLEVARRQPAAHIEIEKNNESRSSPRGEKHSERETISTERGKMYHDARDSPTRSPRRKAVLKRSSANRSSPENCKDSVRKLEARERTMSPDTKDMWSRLKRLLQYTDSGTEEGKDRRNRTEEGKDHRRTETVTRSHRNDDRKSSKHNKDERSRGRSRTTEVKRIRRERKSGSRLVLIDARKLTRRGKPVGGFVESNERRRPVLYQRVKGSLGRRLVMVEAHSSEEECTASRSCSVDSNGPPVHRHDGPPSPLWYGEPACVRRALRTGDLDRPFGECSDEAEDRLWAALRKKMKMESQRSEVAGTASGSSGVGSNGLPVHRYAEPPPRQCTWRRHRM